MRFDEFLGSGTQAVPGRWCTQREHGSSTYPVMCTSASCLFLSCILNDKAVSINHRVLEHCNLSDKWHNPSMISRHWVYSQWFRSHGNNLEWIISIWNGSCLGDWVLSPWNLMLTQVDGATIVLIYMVTLLSSHIWHERCYVRVWGKCVFYWHVGKCVFYWCILWDWQLYGESSGSWKGFQTEASIEVRPVNINARI